MELRETGEGPVLLFLEVCFVAFKNVVLFVHKCFVFVFLSERDPGPAMAVCMKKACVGFIGARQMAEAIARHPDRTETLPARMFAACVNAWV